MVDTSSNKEWEEWQPKSRNGKGTEIDTSPTELVIHGQSFPCINGYCWVDMSALISECYELVSQYKHPYLLTPLQPPVSIGILYLAIM